MPTGGDIRLFDKQAQGLTATNTWDGVADATADRYKYDVNGNIETVARHDGDGHLYDAMHYGHHRDANGHKLKNRPYNIQDLADQPGNYAQDIPQMAYQPNGITDPQDANGTINTANNCSYDALGQRTRDKKADIELIEWTATGKMKKVHHTAASGKPDITFAYDAAGNRILKQVGDPDVDPATGYREHYVLDAQGNIMAVYKYTNNGSASLKVTDRPIYGSKRLGSYTRSFELVGETFSTDVYVNYVQPMNTRLLHYELNDHLGNVTAVVTGRLLPGAGAGSPYQAELLSAQGYEAFGALLPGRNYSSGSYRYLFQGQEHDDEIYGGTGASYDFGARMYDARVGRWLSLDPLAKKYPHVSPYAFAEGNPIYFKDPTGKDAEVTIVGNTVTVTAVIKVYGSGATAAKASEIQASINGYWQAAAHTYTDEKTGQVYNVKFNAVVQMYDPENSEAEPGFFSGRNNPFSTDNFIRLTANQEEQDTYNKANGITTHAGDEYVPGFVKRGDEGVWRADLTGSTWAHEFGHLLGEKDRSHRVFVGESVPGDHKAMLADPGYEFNIMSYSPFTRGVEQINVNYLIKPVVDKYNASDKPSSTGCCNVQAPVYKDKIDP